MEGWIKIHRKIIKWEWYKTPNMYHLFSHLLLNANHDDGKWQGIDIKKGQLITGLKSLKAETGINTQSLRTCIKRLKSTGEITVQVTNKYSIITICNYEEYQIKRSDANNLANNPDNKQLTINQQSTNNKQEYKKNIRRKRKKEEEGENHLFLSYSKEEIKRMKEEDEKEMAAWREKLLSGELN